MYILTCTIYAHVYFHKILITINRKKKIFRKVVKGGKLRFILHHLEYYIIPLNKCNPSRVLQIFKLCVELPNISPTIA